MSEGWTEINASWKGEMLFIGENTAGGTVQMGTMDGKPGVGPMQLLLAGLAGCTGMDIVSISRLVGSLPVECSRRNMDLNREETKPAKAFFRFFSPALAAGASVAFFAPSRFISHSVLENCTEEGTTV
ncbi:MAG: hypothetical protein Q8M58_05955 [Anaerolineales bacterium]|nr:hypothetical protein [Anaerolineales bacterium]